MSSPRATFFFDIDNCLYSRSHSIHSQMAVLIDAYFQTHLSLSSSDAAHLHQKYYKEYGLAIEGLVRHHKVDPLEYNERVDDALPLDSILSRDAPLRALLEDMDKSKVRMWLFTNAYVTHGRRVVDLLGVGDLFEGMTFCDYRAETLVCKPHADAFEKAERDAGVEGGEEVYFVDDNRGNCEHAQRRGWRTVYKLEPGDEEPEEKVCEFRVRRLEELRELFPHLFKSTNGAGADGKGENGHV